ncbi:Uncharacterized protein FWK35_00025346 [Aphis craccivora]|uniref:Secreted protein n=1 Tax=Aphis craccivora TaxID=307492 RepID=A0A6G0YDH5_APHCR|nr:Uncharacterized protein FWK35_00025346 [Aphis craccivora]
MMCVCFFFCVSVTTFWSSKRASIFKLSPVSDRKVNLVGTFGRSFFEIHNSFQKNREKQKKKLRKTRNFHAKPVSNQIDFFTAWL